MNHIVKNNLMGITILILGFFFFVIYIKIGKELGEIAAAVYYFSIYLILYLILYLFIIFYKYKTRNYLSWHFLKYFVFSLAHWIIMLIILLVTLLLVFPNFLK